MDNQHKKIKGYRDLDQEEIDLMNEIKELGSKIELVYIKLRTKCNSFDSRTPDSRWVSIGETHLQQGIMAWVRSVAKPESF